MKRLPVLFLLIILAMTRGEAQLTFRNPILSGFYPDPGICRAGNDYYIVNSSFAYFPGLPVFHSTDLVSWKQIGNAMDRKEQLDLAGAGVSRGLFAPTIRYHNGLFYIVCTLIDKGGNFIITASDPKGPWSNPIWLPQADGIDPSLFFDDDNRAYLVYNSIPPDNKPLYDGHRTIRLAELDAKTLQVITANMIIVNGGTDISQKPVWIEAPHIFKKDGWYYLICAEGGTGYNHSEVVFRSKLVSGPYVPYAGNPILTQRHLDPARKNPVTTAGHADFVETPDGRWYAVFLACRPYEGDHYNIGRETFMMPVQWKDGWPHLLQGNEEVQYEYPVPFPSVTQKVVNPYGGNAVYKDDFSGQSLDPRFMFLRTVEHPWYSLAEKKGYLAMDVRPETAGEKVNPSFVAFRQQNHACEAITALRFSPAAENEKAGLALFQNETHFYYLCQSVSGGKPVVQLFQSGKDSSMVLVASRVLRRAPKQLYLKIEGRGPGYFFSYSTNNKRWTCLTKEEMDGKFLSTKTAGGFVGSVFGLYATSLGKAGSSKAFFDFFSYTGNDDVYKK
ncbi:MAG: glycoside hydrolase family 43 protein [Chitinophagaceae bacterium]